MPRNNLKRINYFYTLDQEPIEEFGMDFHENDRYSCHKITSACTSLLEHVNSYASLNESANDRSISKDSKTLEFYQCTRSDSSDSNKMTFLWRNCSGDEWTVVKRNDVSFCARRNE
ncbi:MAG: hypothetical protein MHPSP_000262 [Paramarteilia canceri]